MAAGVLTPVPPAVDRDSATVLPGDLDTQTILPESPRATGGAVPRRQGETHGATPLSGDPDATGFGAPAGDDPDATRLGGLMEADPDATGFGAPNATDRGETGYGAFDAATGLPDPDTTGLPGKRRTPLDTTSGPLEMGQAFGNRYHIIRLLGLGGMGAVYQAWDAELGVTVALKVVRPEIAANPEAARELERRFKRELLLARQVTHKNVVRIHDLGEIDGIKYITMPFIDGEDLATILKREGKLSVQRTLRIIRTAVTGLVAAHEAGVVHRDLKPANIMIDADDEALIMDFGIARSAGGPGGGTAPKGDVRPADLQRHAALTASQTVAGAIVGTVEYMAPEQAKGEVVDQRADIYALGLIIYDVLIGRRRAEHAPSAIAELQGRMQQAPPAGRSVHPEIPEALDKVLSQCLQPAADARYQTTAAVAADLDRLDADGNLLPIIRRVSLRTMVAAVALMLVALVGTWYFARGPAVPVEHEPVPVLIADFDNRAKDPVFEGTLERALSIAVEGASFITSYDREQARRLAQQLKPGSRLDAATGRLIATREGIKVILAGMIEPKASGYTIAVKAIDPADGKELWTETASAKSKSDVLAAVGSLAAEVRKGLGDTAPKSARLAAAETFTAGSLEAVQSYSLAQDLFSSGKFEESAAYYRRALQQDANFGRAYAGLATSSYHLGRKDEAEQNWKKALSLMDRMTEREKYRTLGTYYLAIARNYEKAIENYSTLVKLYPTDLAGHNNLAFAYFSVLNFPKASEEGRKALELYPKNLLIRNNYALYAMYAGDFQTAAKEAETLVKQEPGFFKNYLPLAVAAIASGKYDLASDAYARMARTGTEGAAMANMGLADLAIYTGRFDEAEALLNAGIVEDEKSKNTALSAAKHIALAEIYELVGKTPVALKEVEIALTRGRQEAVLVPAARIYVRAGKKDQAADLAGDLDNQLQTQARAYAKIIDGNVALANRRMATAIDDFRDAIKLADFWMARFDMGVTYVRAGHWAEALAELEACQKRRGEATAIFLDDTPTFRYLAALPYWLARAQEGLGQQAAAANNYKMFLSLRPDSPADPLVVDAKKRVGP